MTEATIRTAFGEIRITFTNSDELAQVLDKLGDQVNAIEKVASAMVPPSPRIPKPGYETMYRFNSAGDVELLIYPPKSVQLVALALLAYHPEMVGLDVLERVTAMADVSKNILTSGNNKKYFRWFEHRWGLTLEGLRYINATIPPGSPEDPVGINSGDGQLAE